ncbi:hemolysin family protein [Aliarcobacter skirrowii]|nr:hemolysin family protein [Aliarcobacter skirrowii]MCT7446805.1 hemolysin family protein [Aliarcobacter skirrowii]MDX3959861.1 hemolysin family protein [Aliarcobacter skirrowii]MDX4025590.1 hemolysin family protein [Aliarcobacter skirrowii]MDX4036109.1 hemolysin family protein [Aliarcobacter skirrowii]MDX4048401.1 hemolysin family protein [Aliarcobacter skirrowii]
MLLVALILVLLNGFFVLSEFAIVKVRRTKLEEFVKQGKRSASLALKMSNSLDTYLSATQLGITFSSLALGWIGEPALARLIESNVTFLANNPVLLHTISFIIAFSIVTFLHVVFGEIVPKSIAIAKAEVMVLYIARPLYIFWLVFYPLIRFFDIVAASILRALNVKPATEHELAHSEEELRIIVNESFKGGHIDSVESEIIKNAVDFSETVAKEIMTPRKDMICLNSEKSLEENIKRVISTKHTRYPYCNGGKDNIVGMIHSRDILNDVLESKKLDISKLVRPIIMVPENTSISSILTRMNKSRIHLALVVDEYGGTSGLITMDDILEEIIGETTDEHDPKDESILLIDENRYEFDGIVNIEKVEELLDIEFEKDELSAVTIGGRILNLIGRLPIEGETINDKDCTYKILAVNNNRITKILCEKKSKEEETKV